MEDEQKINNKQPTYGPTQIKQIVLQNPPVFTSDIRNLDWIGDSEELAANLRNPVHALFCDNFCILVKHPAEHYEKQPSGKMFLTKPHRDTDRGKIIEAYSETVGKKVDKINGDIKTLETKAANVDGSRFTKIKIAIPEITLTVHFLALFVSNLLKKPDIYICDIDLTEDYAGHLDY
jgi:hypothetical protein